MTVSSDYPKTREDIFKPSRDLRSDFEFADFFFPFSSNRELTIGLDSCLKMILMFIASLIRLNGDYKQVNQ